MQPQLLASDEWEEFKSPKDGVLVFFDDAVPKLFLHPILENALGGLEDFDG